MKKFDLSNTTTAALTISKSGIPCLWECGGGWSNTGNTQIISNSSGNAKRPLHVRTHGDLCCENHALIPVVVGDHIVTADRHHDNVNVVVYRITAIGADKATMVSIDNVPVLENAIEAAVAKSYDYHCRRPYYIAVPTPAPAPIAPPADDAEFDFDDDFGPDDDDELLD